jgi:hypothetical protein
MQCIHRLYCANKKREREAKKAENMPIPALVRLLGPKREKL